MVMTELPQSNHPWDIKPCKYCGCTPPNGHWKPYTWMYKHQQNCPHKPKK